MVLPVTVDRREHVTYVSASWKQASVTSERLHQIAAAAIDTSFQFG